MTTVSDLLAALSEDVHNAAEKAAAKQFSDVSVSLDTAKKRIADGQQALRHADRQRFVRQVWTLFGGPASDASSAPHTGTTLLDCLSALQDAACTSTDSASAKAMSETLQLLRTILVPGFRSGASVLQLLRVKNQVWGLLTTLDLLNKFKDAQTEGLLLIAALVDRAGPSTSTATPAQTSSSSAAVSLSLEEETEAATRAIESTAPQLSAVQINAEEVMHRCMSIAGKTAAGGQRVRAVALQLLGTLMVAFSDALGKERVAVRNTFEEAANRLSRQHEVEQVVGEGLLDGLSAFLGVFPLHFHVAAEQQFIIFIHQLVKNALLLAESSTNYRFCDAALRFLTARAVDTLAVCIMQDAHSYLVILHRLWLHKNRNVHRAAYAATPSCLQALSQQLVAAATALTVDTQCSHPAPSHAGQPVLRPSEEVIEGVLSMVKRLLSESGSTPAELSFLFVVCGYMARPLRACITTDALEALFSQVIAKTDWLLPSTMAASVENSYLSATTDTDAFYAQWVDTAMPHEPEAETLEPAQWHDTSSVAPLTATPQGDGFGREDIARLIPHLLVAFSCFLAEVDRMTTEAQRALSSLLDVMLRMLPSDLYFERLRHATVPSLLKLLLVTAHKPTMGFDVCTFLCERLVWMACVVDTGGVQHSTPSVQQGHSEARGLSVESMPVWWRRAPAAQRQHTYVSFLRALIDGSATWQPSRWGEPWCGLDLADIGQRLRAEMTRVVLESAQAVNITVLFKGRPASINVVLAHSDGAVGGDVEDALLPASPGEYGFFLSLVRLHSALARSLWSRHDCDGQGGALGERLSLWVQELAPASTAAPHASGYYTLLYTALQSAMAAVGGVSCTNVMCLLTNEASRTLVRWLSRCEGHLFTYTQDLLYQCAAAYITIVAACKTCTRASDGEVDETRDGTAPGYGALQRAFTVVLVSAPVASISSQERSSQSLGAALDPLEDGEARTIEATVRFVLGALRSLVERQPPLAAQLLPALLASPELAERGDVRAVLEELTARNGDVIAKAMLERRVSGSDGANASAAAASEPAQSRGLVPPPQWRTEKALLALPFPSDATVDFPITVVLARVAHLSCHASQQRIRSPAAELLHFAIVWLLGVGKKEAERAGDGDSGAASWLPAVLPSVLHLASGQTQDGVAQELFRDVLLQTARWTSLLPSRWPKSSSAALAQRVFEKVLCDHLSSQHAALRRTAAEAIEEYLCWCSRQLHELGISRTAAASAVQTQCAGVLVRVRLDVRSTHTWARLGAVMLLHRLVLRMRRGDADDPAHEPPPLCTLLLSDWMSWLFALADCLRLALRPGDSGGTGTASGIADSDDGDTSGLIAESVAAFDAVHELLTDGGAAGDAARAALLTRRGAPPLPQPRAAEPSTGADTMVALASEVVALCWMLSTHRQYDSAVTSLWRVLALLCACLLPAAQGRASDSLVSAGHGSATTMQWLLHDEAGQATLCAVMARGIVDGADQLSSLLSTLRFCSFLSTVNSGLSAANTAAPLRGAKRLRSGGREDVGAVAAVMTRVVSCATQQLRHADDDALLSALTQFVQSCLFDTDTDDEAGVEVLVDTVAVRAQILTATPFIVASRALFFEAHRSHAMRLAGQHAVSTLYLLSRSSGNAAARAALLMEVRGALPATFTAVSSSDDAWQRLSHPLSARTVLEALSAVASLGWMQRPASAGGRGNGAVNAFADVFEAMPSSLQEQLRVTWWDVLQRVVLDEHATALPRTERHALLVALFGVCFGMVPTDGHSAHLVTALASVLHTLDDACTLHASVAPSMAPVAAACGTALRRLFISQTHTTRTARATVDDLICTVCEAVERRLFRPSRATADSATAGTWQTQCELPAMLLLQLLGGSGWRHTSHNSSRPSQFTLKATSSVRIVRCLLSPLLSAPSQQGNVSEEGEEGESPAAVWHDASRMTFVLQALSGIGACTEATAFLEDAPVARLVSALASAGGQSERWTGAVHGLLSSSTAVRLHKLAVQVLCVCGLASSAPSPQRACVLDSARAVLASVLRDELPLDWKELASGSTEAAMLPHVVRSIVTLTSAMAAHEPEVMTRLLPLLAQTDMPDTDWIGDTVTSAIHNLPLDKRLALCESCVQLQCGGGLPSAMWWAATYRLILPVLASLPPGERQSFFASHAAEWVATAGRPPHAAPHAQTNALVLLESMYRQNEASLLRGAINDAYVASRGTGSSTTPTGKELVLAVIKVCSGARAAETPTTAGGGGETEDWMSYRQAALRCLVAVVTATQQQEAVFVKLLLDAGNVDGWCKVVDVQALTELPVECDFPLISEQTAKGSSDWELHGRRRNADKLDAAHQVGSLLENIRADELLDAAAAASESDSMWLAPSVQFGTRLSTVGALEGPVFSAAAVAGPGLDGESGAAATAAAVKPGRDVLVDGTWRSTCLGAFFSALDHMITHFHTTPQGKWAPLWVTELHALLTNPAQPVQVRLVATRLVLLRPEYFATYADHFVEPLMDTVSDPALGNQLHYVAREAVYVVVSWLRQAGKEEEASAVQSDPDIVISVSAATKLLRYIVTTLQVSITKSDSESFVLRNNIDLFKGVCGALGVTLLSQALRDAHIVSLLEAVGAAPAASSCASSSSAVPSSAARQAQVEMSVQVLGVVVNSGICLGTVWSPPHAAALYQRLARLVSHGAMVVAVAAAEVLAVELQALALGAPSDEATGRLRQELEAQLRGAIESQWGRSAVTGLSALRVVEAYHPSILSPNLAMLIFTGFPTRVEEEQLLVLDILGSSAETTATMYSTVSAQFAGALGSFRGSVRIAAYTLMQLITPFLSLSAVCQLALMFLSSSALDVVQHNTEERTRFFQFAVAAHARVHLLRTREQGIDGASAHENRAAQRPNAQNEEDEAATQTESRLIHLLTTDGLAEASSPFVQDIILSHLDEAYYPDPPLARLRSILHNLTQTKGLGQHTNWIRHAAVLVLSPCRRTRAYGDVTFVFDTPLADCPFSAKQFSATATQGTQGRQGLPLFSQSLGSLGARASGIARASAPFTYVGASQKSVSDRHSMATEHSGGGRGAAAASARKTADCFAWPAPLDTQATEHYRGTGRRQPTLFASSVQPHGLVTASLTTHQAQARRTTRSGASQVCSQLLSHRGGELGEAPSGGHASAGGSRRPARGIFARRLRALPLASRDVLHMAASSRDRQDRERRAKEEQLQQLRHRVLFRLYRDGKLPDVQVPIAAFLAPLQALCLYDTVTAQLTTVALVKAMMPVSAAEASSVPLSSATQGVSGSDSGSVPFFARPGNNEQDDARRQAQAGATDALCAFLLTATKSLSVASPTLAVHTVQELLLFTAHRWRKEETSSALSRQLIDLVAARRGNRALAAVDDEAVGGAASFAEALALSSVPAVASGAWAGLAQLLGMMGETDLLCEAFQRAAGRDTHTHACLQTLQRALRATESGAYEQALALFATCARQLPASVDARYAVTRTDLRQLLSHRQQEAAQAALLWEEVGELCTGADSVEAAAVAVEAYRHIAPTKLPAAFGRLCDLGGGLGRVAMDFPFETACVRLLDGDWVRCETHAHQGISHVLKGFSSGQALLDEEAVHACHEAYRLHQAQLVGRVMALVTEERPEAERVVRRLAATGFRPIVSPTASLADSALWLQKIATAALAKPFTRQFGESAWQTLKSVLADTRLALCSSSCESLLRSPHTNGAVKALLDVVVVDKEGPSASLYGTALRANLYRLAHAGPQRKDKTTDELISGLQRRVHSKAGQLPPEEQRALQMDVDWCAAMLLLHHSSAEPRANTTVLLDVFLYASSMHRHLSESVEDHLRLLGVMDRLLGGVPRRAAAAANEEAATESETDEDAETNGDAQTTHWVACWELYLSTFVWCVKAIGAGKVANAGVQADIAMHVPRALQYFDIITAGADCAQVEAVEEVAARLVHLPAAIWRPWPSQLISTLLRTRKPLLAEILQRVADAFPQIVYYPYNCAAEELHALEATGSPDLRDVLRTLRCQMDTNARVRRARVFAEALLTLHEPALRLRDDLRVLVTAYRQYVDAPADAPLRETAFAKAEALFQTSWRQFADVHSMASTETVRLKFREFAVPWLGAFAAESHSGNVAAEAIRLTRSWEQFKMAYKAAATGLQQAAHGTATVARIGEYSATLEALLLHATDHAGGTVLASQTRQEAREETMDDPLEMPKQPVLALEFQHASTSTLYALSAADAALLRGEYVVGANPVLRVQSSLQKPKRLELYSSLMNTHVYLAKGGDDLRLDQRVEELFCVLNRHLQRQETSAMSAAGTHAALYVHTYSVIPVSAQVGLVEWVAHTETLQSAMEGVNGHPLAESPAFITYRKRFEAGTTAYIRSLQHDSPSEAGRWYEQLVGETPHGLLHHALQQVSPSLCRWYAVRDGFVKSNAALSISAHVFGIGDRHLSNFLVSTETGRLIGIDYGHAFGSATETLPIPELVPFRLTPQIRDACGVLGEVALTSAMTRVLHTLIQHRSVMESLTQAFVHEPLTQWKQLKPDQREAYALRKLHGVAQKLDLDSPWNSLLANLRHNQHLLRLEKEWNGGSGHWLLARIRNAVLDHKTGHIAEDGAAVPDAANEENQAEARNAEMAYVQQLVDLAQNSAVLSRAYVGWNPLF